MDQGGCGVSILEDTSSTQPLAHLSPGETGWGTGRAKVGKPMFCDKDKLTGKTKAACVK